MFFLPILLLSMLASSQDALTLLEKTPSPSISSSESRNFTSVSITNNIDESMLGYKHWTGTHKPENFSIEINGKTIKQGETYETTSDKPLQIRYNYSFMNGMYKGGKTMSYQFNKDSKQASLTFSWNNDPRVLLENAEIIAEK